MIHPSSLLRRAIQADAIFSGVSAVLIAYTALVGWLGTRPTMPKALVAIVIAGNAAWALASIALLFSDAVTPNLLGEVAIAMQAIVVGTLAELQYVGLRRSGATLAV